MALKDEFSELYRREHALHFTPERTTLEVDTLVAALTLRPHERVLDLGCGWGRHLTELKQRGFTGLVGIDVQGAFLEPVDGVTMLAGDAGALEFENEFDAVYCAFNALFSAPDAAPKVFASVARALKPGGRFLLDTANRERLAVADPTRSWRGGGDLPWLLEETRFNLLTGAQEIFQRRIFTGSYTETDHTETLTLTRYHYTLSDLTRLLQTHELTVTDVYGDWTLNPYTAQSPRLLLLTRKEV